MPRYYKPRDGSKGNKYHIVDHGRDNLIPTTEEEIRRSDLEPCRNCVRHHGLIPLSDMIQLSDLNY